ncbi:MAG: hypothetical protein V1845_01775 [bacterium]
MSEKDVMVYKEKVEKMSRGELEKNAKIEMNWLADCFGHYDEFKTARDARRTMHDFKGVEGWLNQLSISSKELCICFERLHQIAKEDINHKEKFDRE